VLLLLFALHVLTGCLHNLIAWRFYPDHGDIWFYFHSSILMTNELRNNFHTFLLDYSTWNLFTHNALATIDIILNFFSRENIYVNTLLFSFPVFLGTTALFRVLRHHFPDSMLTALSTYLLPSVLFWTSCVHREGAIYMFLGFFLYSLDHRSWKSAVLYFLLISYFRSAVALTLIPALIMIIWRWPSPTPRRKNLLLAAGLGLLLVLVLAGPRLLKGLAVQQQAFQILNGNSRINLPVLDGTPASLLHTLPAAMLNGWFEPLPGTGGQIVYLLFSMELLLIWAVVVLSLLRRPTLNSFSIGCIVFALLSMLLMGLIVPFVGAIVRYRSIYLPFILAPFLYQLCTRTILRRFDQWIALKL